MNKTESISPTRAALAVFTLYATLYGAAAQAAGFIDTFKSIEGVVKAALTLFVWSCLLVGAIAFAKGILLMKEKGGSRGEDVKMSSIMWCIGGGLGLIVIWFIIIMTVESVGGSKSDIGKQIF